MGQIEIIAHRGWWRQPEERNTPAALRRAFAAGLGIETDVRDRAGEIVISHDPPAAAGTLWTLRDILEAYVATGKMGTLALNIKADGLQTAVMTLLRDFAIDRYFVFDMSIPDTLQWLRAGARFFSRQSEYEPTPALYDASEGVWLDGFKSDWFTSAIVRSHLAAGKKVAIVSSELHQRDPATLWEFLQSFNQEHVILCTDRVAEARRYFHGQN